MFFSRSGRYGIFDQQGTFSIEDGRLVTRLTHRMNDSLEEGRPEWSTIERPVTDAIPLSRDGHSRMTLMLDGRRVRFMRCSQANYEFMEIDLSERPPVPARWTRRG